MKKFPDKLKKGDLIKVIAPSRSLAILSQESIGYANTRFEDLGLKLDFGKHIKEKDDFVSSSIDSRVEDLHEAFSNKKVKGIITVIGGFNCNQLLHYIDWDLLKSNPKIFCGFSDITALNNSIYSKVGLVTYSGPHYSTFGQKLYLDYTIEYFKQCLMSDKPFDVIPSQQWSDDEWYKYQDDRHLINNSGFLVINNGEAEGIILGANLCTFNLLQGTEYMPSLKNTILFIEDDYESVPHTFDRNLQSLIHQPGFDGVKGIVIGRFQRASNMTDNLLKQIIENKKELNPLPVIANIDFGHTDPKITFPIGGHCKITASGDPKITIIKH
ncbi:peptidase S66 [Candidatus Woesebacteria bacterium RBG_16_34_12]|uniref:Peptidase S66 n=1 Tax=Candidatus Woesebacteria bacterium RBG_16_34_12 TaxID=1802480 RepID=A0A1F7X8T8_9BACT|nr:MAG: peptidase S66 [Candidatus Woesebacteria bacterium RBG_16_34_12]